MRSLSFHCAGEVLTVPPTHTGEPSCWSVGGPGEPGKERRNAMSSNVDVGTPPELGDRDGFFSMSRLVPSYAEPACMGDGDGSLPVFATASPVTAPVIGRSKGSAADGMASGSKLALTEPLLTPPATPLDKPPDMLLLRLLRLSAFMELASPPSFRFPGMSPLRNASLSATRPAGRGLAPSKESGCIELALAESGEMTGGFAHAQDCDCDGLPTRLRGVSTGVGAPAGACPGAIGPAVGSWDMRPPAS
mmetsp:Transcript_13977/g.41679  ORF Transcript_13977/g.41679 Transcript_13977/m.41679 type:complete len:248 (-) Transcript_13977:881-1624(-)